jgi:hypothetical protein
LKPECMMIQYSDRSTTMVMTLLDMTSALPI